MNCFGPLSNQFLLVILLHILSHKIDFCEQHKWLGTKRRSVFSFQYFGHHCLQHNSSCNYVLASWKLCPWILWNPKVRDSVETGNKFLAWPLAFCANLDHGMSHPVSLCFHSFKNDGENSAQKSQDNGDWQERRSPAPAAVQSRLSCGLRPGYSEIHPVRAGNLPRLETAQLPWALALLLGCPDGKKVSPYLQPEPPMFQLVLLPPTLPPHTAVRTMAMSPPSSPADHGDAAGCFQSHPFSQLNQPWSHSLSLQDKGSSPTASVASPHLPPVLSTLKR